MHVGLFAVYTVLSVAGVVVLRGSLPRLVSAFRDGGPWLPQVGLPALGATMYMVSFFCWLAILATTPASRAYPVAVALTLFGVTVTAALFLGERIGWPQVVGVVAIFAGIVLLTRPVP